MTPARAQHWFEPGDSRLTGAACALICAVVVGPVFWFAHFAPLLATALLTAGVMLFSVRRSLVVLLVATAVIPGPVLEFLRIPLGFKLTEVLLIATLLFLAIDVVWARRLRVTTTGVDGLVAVFLAVALLSALLGAYYDNHDKGYILVNLRYPLYYVAFFAATQAFSPRDGARLIAPVLMLVGPVVGATYIFEFLGAIDLSTGKRFFRVLGPQGVVLPVAMLVIANLLIHDPRRFGRVLPALAFLPTGLAFVLTVGRGMWVAFAVGLATTLWIRHRSRPRGARHAWGAQFSPRRWRPFSWPRCWCSSASPGPRSAPTPSNARAPSSTSAATCRCWGASWAIPRCCKRLPSARFSAAARAGP